jgi:RNA polymerase sigma-70 factor, ECF subfamily
MRESATADDPELIRGIAAGSEESFRLLYERWAPRLGRFLERATGSREAGEDLLQETFIRVIRAAPGFDPRGATGAWLYRIAANLAYSHWRRIRAAPTLEHLAPGDAGDVAAPEAGNPEEDWQRASLAAAVRRAVTCLPENQRLVFLLKVDQELSYEAIATVLHCPVGTAKSRFHHAVRRLRELMDAPAADGRARGAGSRRDHHVL